MGVALNAFTLYRLHTLVEYRYKLFNELHPLKTLPLMLLQTDNLTVANLEQLANVLYGNTCNSGSSAYVNDSIFENAEAATDVAFGKYNDVIPVYVNAYAPIDDNFGIETLVRLLQK